MKKLIPILAVLALIATACGAGNAEPTAIPLPTAMATNEGANPTAEVVSGGDAGEERVSSVDGMPQVYVPEGTFRMGGIGSGTQPDERPDHNVTMKAFWIDKLEVTNGMYDLCVRAGECDTPQKFNSENRDSYYGNAEFVDFPVVYVTWLQADNYCKWAGRHLPTEAEWERAARGDDYRIYPWGDDRPDSSRGNFNYFVNDTARVGSYPAGASPFGALDLIGNVNEWVADFYDASYYGLGVTSNPSGPAARSQYFGRVIRGGSYQESLKDVRLSNRGTMIGSDPSVTDIYSPEYLGDFSPKVGFRCATD